MRERARARGRERGRVQRNVRTKNSISTREVNKATYNRERVVGVGIVRIHQCLVAQEDAPAEEGEEELVEVRAQRGVGDT